MIYCVLAFRGVDVHTARPSLHVRHDYWLYWVQCEIPFEKLVNVTACIGRINSAYQRVRG